MLQLTQKKVNNLFKENSLNARTLKLKLIYTTVKNLKVANAQLYNELQACNFNMLQVTHK